MSFTFADNKLGGRLTAACDAIGQGHLRRAAGIFNEISEELNVEAEEADGLLGEEQEPPPQPEPQPTAQPNAMDLQSCARNVHMYGAPDPVTSWRTCQVCGSVNVTGV
jgi:hypothetical protein